MPSHPLTRCQYLCIDPPKRAGGGGAKGEGEGDGAIYPRFLSLSLSFFPQSIPTQARRAHPRPKAIDAEDAAAAGGVGIGTE